MEENKKKNYKHFYNCEITVKFNRSKRKRYKFDRDKNTQYGSTYLYNGLSIECLNFHSIHQSNFLFLKKYLFFMN